MSQELPDKEESPPEARSAMPLTKPESLPTTLAKVASQRHPPESTSVVRRIIWALLGLGGGSVGALAACELHDQYFLIGLLLGTIWGQATLAAAWAALGPGWVVVRVPGSVAWLCGLTVFVGAGAMLGRRAPDANEMSVIIGLCLAGQWVAVQAPLWLLVAFYRLRVGHRDASAAMMPLQFEIRQLMLVTAIIGVLLGIGRSLVISGQLKLLVGGHGETGVFMFLTVAGIATTLPLLLAMLLHRFSRLAVALSLLFLALVTYAEMPLLAAAQMHGPEFAHIVWINVVQAAWIMLIAGLMRVDGYRLRRG